MENDSVTLVQYERAYGPFTHMSQSEKAIWLRWLQRGGVDFAPFKYDVRVGDGLAMPAGSSSYAISSAAALTTKRIDAVYKQGNTTVIVEVKVRTGLSAVGQLIGYAALYRLTPGFTGEIAMLLITDALQPDVAHVLDIEGIHWAVV